MYGNYYIGYLSGWQPKEKKDCAMPMTFKKLLIIFVSNRKGFMIR